MKDIQKKIALLEKAQDTLCAITRMKKRWADVQERSVAWRDWFPDLAMREARRSEIIEKAMIRLEQRYHNIISQL